MQPEIFGRAQSKREGRLGNYNLIKDVPQDFVIEATPTFKALARRRRAIVEHTAPGVGGHLIFRHMVLGEAFAEHRSSGIKIGTCIGRAFNRIISTEELGDMKNQRKAKLRNKAKARRRAPTIGSAQSPAQPDEEPAIRTVSLDEPGFEPQISAHSIDNDQNIVIGQFLASLPYEQQELVGLCLIDGVSIRDAAARLGMTRSTADRQLQGLKTQLRELLVDEGIKYE